MLKFIALIFASLTAHAAVAKVIPLDPSSDAYDRYLASVRINDTVIFPNDARFRIVTRVPLDKSGVLGTVFQVQALDANGAPLSKETFALKVPAHSGVEKVINSRGQVVETIKLTAAIDELIDGYPDLVNHDVPVVKMRGSLAGKYILSEWVPNLTIFRDYLTHPPTGVTADHMLVRLMDFAKEISPFASVRDLNCDNLIFDPQQDAWRIVDYRAVYHPSPDGSRTARVLVPAGPLSANRSHPFGKHFVSRLQTTNPELFGTRTHWTETILLGMDTEIRQARGGQPEDAELIRLIFNRVIKPGDCRTGLKTRPAL